MIATETSPQLRKEHLTTPSNRSWQQRRQTGAEEGFLKLVRGGHTKSTASIRLPGGSCLLPASGTGHWPPFSPFLVNEGNRQNQDMEAIRLTQASWQTMMS